jgi:integrase/recombinase XerD
VREGLRRDDPSAELDAPRIPRSLPKTLSEADVEALLAAPEEDTTLGLRDRAMLETLYASGLRVSELVTLKTIQVNLDMGVVRVLGKGAKERLTPLGEEAVAWIVRYQREARPQLLGARKSDGLFLTAHGKPMTRQSFWNLVKRHAAWRASARPSRRIPCATPSQRTSSTTARIFAWCRCCSATPTSHHADLHARRRERLKALHKKHHPRG